MKYLEAAKKEIETYYKPGAIEWIDKTYPEEYEKALNDIDLAMKSWNGSQYDPEFWAAIRKYKETMINLLGKYNPTGNFWDAINTQKQTNPR